MKLGKTRVLAALAALVIGLAPALWPAGPPAPVAAARVTKVVIMRTADGTAQRATTDTTIYTRRLTFQSRVGSAATWYVGDSSVSSSNHFASLSAGQAYSPTLSVYAAERGESFRLSDWYVKGTASDVIAISYEVITAP